MCSGGVLVSVRRKTADTSAIGAYALEAAL
jgi:hypothetical protein